MTLGAVVAGLSTMGGAATRTASKASAVGAKGTLATVAFVMLLAAEVAAAVERRRDRRHHSRVVSPVEPRESPLR